MDKKNFAFDKMNFVFVLMSGGGSDETTYDPSIFDARHTKVAPLVCFVGFVSMIYAIIRKPKDKSEDQ